MPDCGSRYSFYITPNSNKTVLYCGVTNNLEQRLIEHFLDKGTPDRFASRCFCYWLVYYEHFKYIHNAIAREKEVKKWRTEKKEALIDALNPERKFLNFELFDHWPPTNMFHRKDL